ncbi:hypothetical protein NVP1144O_51 [Vibrio phage 1.144.O._10N.286.45.B3]|nr:hypothetical protein NVP1144O_51 [Vibrio phage 1.144.O._10N.286.45.B3]
MCETKFTKGPWFVDQDFCIMTSSDITDEPMICDLMPAEMSDNEIANANLIAASPEMYDMLHSIENDANQIPPFLWDKIQTVLAKARGEHV